MSNKKQATVKQTVLHTIQVGDVIGEIRLKKTNSGFCYLDYSLERTFSTSTNKQSRGATFFAVNQANLIQVIRESSAWIEARGNSLPAMDTAAEQAASNQ
jgi:S-adenosylmethionine hydrolase